MLAKEGNVPPVSPWDEYWRLTREAAAHKAGGPQVEVLRHFWTSFFSDALSYRSGPRVLDLACGNGAVTGFALNVAARSERGLPSVVAIDTSLAALKDLKTRFPSVLAVASDAKRTPFDDQSFDVVASQFGVEYAGIEAIEEAARLVARGGTLAAILHLKKGAIYRECATNLQAILAVESSGILPATRDAFTAGIAAATGRIGNTDLQRRQTRFVKAGKAVERVLRRHGHDVAGGVVQRLHADIAQMYRRMGAHDPSDVANWIDDMAREVKAYAARMSSMLAAAIDEPSLDKMVNRITVGGLSVRIRDKLHMGVIRQEPAA
ncbi:MAG: class I SAM-dependent methyltransferase, partial [Candidatus Dormibacteraeota bacterium]|nr:class I SAM-dependent methyltransferase [Candidatus Dormibacteraeota bacterium]